MPSLKDLLGTVTSLRKHWQHSPRAGCATLGDASREIRALRLMLIIGLGEIVKSLLSHWERILGEHNSCPEECRLLYPPAGGKSLQKQTNS